MIVVSAENTDKVQLVLDNAKITTSTSVAIYVLEADKVFMHLLSLPEDMAKIICWIVLKEMRRRVLFTTEMA